MGVSWDEYDEPVDEDLDDYEARCPVACYFEVPEDKTFEWARDYILTMPFNILELEHITLFRAQISPILEG